MIILLTGNGKGKTTAAIGQAVRVLGRGKSALIIQFIKGSWKSGEDEFAAAAKIPDSRFVIRKMGLGFVGIAGDALPIEQHKEAAQKALDAFIEEKKTGLWHLIVLDEINVAVALGLLAPKKVLDAIKDFPEDKILMLTGRGAPQEFIDAADIATEMKEIKHPFQNGKEGREMVEF